MDVRRVWPGAAPGSSTQLERTSRPTGDPELARLYRGFAAAGLTPLWTQRDLMPASPQPSGVPALWRWSTLYPLAARAGELVPVGRGGERRAIAPAEPELSGEPYATATLRAAIQCLGPRGPARHPGTRRPGRHRYAPGACA